MLVAAAAVLREVATKDDIRELRREVENVRRELEDVKKEVAELREGVSRLEGLVGLLVKAFIAFNLPYF